MRRHQGNIAGGIGLIVVATLAAALLCVMAFTLPNGIEHMFKDFKFFIMMPLVIFMFVLGIILIVRGKADREIRTYGGPGRCTIEEIHWVVGRYGRSYVMTVSFIDEDGLTNETVVDLGRYCDIDLLKVGMEIECTIFGDRCYVDKDNIVILSNQEEEEL